VDSYAVIIGNIRTEISLALSWISRAVVLNRVVLLLFHRQYFFVLVLNSLTLDSWRFIPQARSNREPLSSPCCALLSFLRVISPFRDCNVLFAILNSSWIILCSCSQSCCVVVVPQAILLVLVLNSLTLDSWRFIPQACSNREPLSSPCCALLSFLRVISPFRDCNVLFAILNSSWIISCSCSQSCCVVVVPQAIFLCFGIELSHTRFLEIYPSSVFKS